MLEPKEFELLSGKKLVVNIANFGTAIQLSQALLKCLKNADIKFDKDSLNSLDFANLTENPILIGAFAKAALDAFTDSTIDVVFWEMAKKCTYDGLRVTEELFNNSVDARQDFYQLKFLILKENVLPFFPQLRTTLAEKQK